MEECFICGAPISRVRLFDAISEEGVVKICEFCSREEDIPIIRKPTSVQLKESERKQSFYERASDLIHHREEQKKTPMRQKQDISLREIVERNYQDKVSNQMEKQSNPEMIDNFHWIIMRARRMKKLTQNQLAKELSESESAINLAEQGILPGDNHKLVNKLENYLGIRIIRPEFASEVRVSEKTKKIGFDMQTSKELTIADLQEMKKRRETEELPEFETEQELENVEEIRFVNEEIPEVEQNHFEQEKNGLTREEMDKILFGK